MNARSHLFQFTCELCEVEEIVSSIFHTLLFHRSTGKFHYKKEGSYTIGTLGYEDVDCHFLDLTYVRCACPDLDESIRQHVNHFKEALRSMDRCRSGQISLEFYQRKKNPWPFPMESVPWELWTVKVDVITVNSERDRQALRDTLAEQVTEKIFSIVELVNRPEFVPKMPNEPDLGNIFDTKIKSVQPYLHKIYSNTCSTPSQSVGDTVRKLFRDTFSY